LKTIKGNQTRVPKKAATAPIKPETPKSRQLDLEVKEGTSLDRAVTDMAAAGLAGNAGLVVKFSKVEHGELSLTDMVKSLKASGTAVNANNFAGAEQMLNAQAIALNSIFCEMARRSACNMGEYIEPTEIYMRLALRAQNQCRATLETLAAIKNPPVVFAKQANITSGPQQVNNGVISAPSGEQKLPPAHGESETEQIKLLEGVKHGGTVLDAGTEGAAARGRQVVEAVGAIHRPQKPRRQVQG